MGRPGERRRARRALLRIRERNGRKAQATKERHKRPIVANQPAHRDLSDGRYTELRHACGSRADAMANAFETAIALVLRYRGGIDGNVDGLEASGCEFVQPLVMTAGPMSLATVIAIMSARWVEKRFAA